ncbi:MAG: hypothetical protein JXQ82_00485 [Methanomicrobiaceae archaeon]|nr:hypothetical protein [Methanomicrobiaceae archaeon]
MQVFSILIWIILLKFIQISIWPLLKKAVGDFSYGISYPASLLIFALLSWYSGFFGVTLYASLFIFAILFIFFAYNGEYSGDKIAVNLRWDFVFFMLFLFMLEVRYLNPSISYAEKFMDHAFLASVMNNPAIPPVDPWYSGGNLDVYYYLGHWTFGALGVMSGIKSTVVFNLILPTVFANIGVSLYASGKLLLKKYQWLPVLTIFVVNPAFIYHLLLGKSITAVMWDSTRTIDAAITEYPVFSMLWGDPHAHVISLFNQAFFLFLLIYCYLKWNESDDRSKWILAILMSISLGSMPLLNTWDVLIYAPALLVFGFLIFLKNRDDKFIKNLPLRIILLVPALSVLIYLPYYLMLNAGGIEGIAIVNSPTEPFAFILVYGFFLLVLYLECIKDIIQKPYLIIFGIPFILLGYFGAGLCIIPISALISRKKLLPQDILASLGLLIIIFTETFYLRDNMGEAYFRMNTVFKFSIIAWMMLGISTAVFIGKYLEKRNSLNNEKTDTKKKSAFVAIIICALLLTPLILPDLNYGYGGKTLDGMEWMKIQHPYEYNAIDYLREQKGSISIVEAEDGDYTYYSRVSSMTGYPTIIGMPFHEQMWRGDAALVGERMSDIKKIYENPKECASLMEKYSMTHIFVGEPENKRYNLNLPYDLLTIVYQNDGVVIYALK